MVEKMSEKMPKKIALDMRLTLIAFALVPMILSVIIVSIVLISTSSKELKDSVRSSMGAVVEKTGEAFDYSTDYSCEVIKSYATAPIIQEYLKNPTNSLIADEAEQYTIDFFNSLEGWEGIYLADWNSQVLAHPAPPVVGKVMREGDRLTELQNMMLANEGVTNVGIITSPASGELIQSFYYPVFDAAGSPIGYVGAGTFVHSVVANFSDVKTLGMDSAYIYFVDPTGIMLYHPDESKIGNMAENDAVKGLVARMAAGEHPAPDCIEYKYKGAKKYAAYYIGDNDNYIAVLTADEAEAMESINKNVILTIILCLVCVVICVVVSVFVARTVANPLSMIAEATNLLSTGDVTVECDTTSKIKETASIIAAFGNLKNALNTSMANVKNSANALNSAIISVDGMTNDNVESITQINTAIDEVASTSQAVAQSAQEMAEQAVELGNNIETLDENVTSLYDASLTIRSVNNDATNCMNAVYQGAKESVSAVTSITEKIAETNTAIEEIERAVHAIEEIAAQTNLLSLNASIEAARAGEAGAGFAVVASEIRSLADSSAKSANEIKDIIINVMNLSNSTVEVSNKVYEIISKEENDIEAAQEQFNVLSESVEASIKGINTIKQMTGKLDDIKVGLTNATSDLGAISEELGASAQEVAASCQTVTAACTDTQNSTTEMREINDNMSSAIEFFKL